MATKRDLNQQPLKERVLQFIRENRLLSSGEKLVVAVSGGPDSVCLLHILASLKSELGIELHAAHLNHQLREAESEADAKYVSTLAKKLGIPVTIEKEDVKGYQAKKRLSLEEAAREVRYSFLAEAASSVGATKVAVGHTQDDHVETVLMHLIRGSGTRGLSGLQPLTVMRSAKENLNITRPLLEISRKETEDYCEQNSLNPRRDSSNKSLSPLRNRIRLKLLPLLKRYNPRFPEALLRTSRIAGDDIAFLDEKTAEIWDKVILEQPNAIALDKERLDRLPPTLQRYLLRAAAEKLLGSAKDVEMRHIEAMTEALNKPAGKRLNLTRGLTFYTEYDKYLLTLGANRLSPLPVLEGEVPLKIPGETVTTGWRIKATIIKKEQIPRKVGSFTACFDYEKTGNQLVVRPRRRGDRFQPLGLKSLKKLGEFMIDAKIPSLWRQNIPIVYSDKQIIWVVGWRIDERVKVTGDTTQVLCLEFKQG